LAGLSATFCAIFLYPYLIYPLVLRLLSKKAIRPAPVDYRISLLFCAYNEIECLPGKIDNLRELKRNRPELQILVYDDCSNDGTSELLASVPELLTVVQGPGRTGKAAGMKRLVQSARGEILLFTDADVLLPSDAIDRLLPYYGDPEVGGICCTVIMLSGGGSATSHIGTLYWSWDDRLQRLESATGNVMGAQGALFSVRRELYPNFPDTVQDDFAVSMSVVLQGKRLVKATDVIAFTQSVSHRGEELRRKVRIGARAYHTHLFLRPQLRRMTRRDRFKYASRKFLRWFGGLFLTLAMVTGLAAIALVSLPLAGLVLPLGAAVVAIAASTHRGPLAKAGQIVVATFATLVGVLQAMRGRTVATWSPAKSRSAVRAQAPSA
jgi:cellulose synthase/poly-beta-1,6-N-acetylglucosamine synthase-like glycosyltransferase